MDVGGSVLSKEFGSAQGDAEKEGCGVDGGDTGTGGGQSVQRAIVDSYLKEREEELLLLPRQQELLKKRKQELLASFLPRKNRTGGVVGEGDGKQDAAAELRENGVGHASSSLPFGARYEASLQAYSTALAASASARKQQKSRFK
jgi:hypothetical protein